MLHRLSPNNWPFGVKLFLPCLFMIGMGITMHVLSTRVIDNLNHNIAHIVNTKFKASALLSENIDLLRVANGKLYALQIKKAAGMEQKIDHDVDDIKKTLDSAASALSEFTETYATEDTKPRLQKAIEEIKTYKDAVAFVGSMLDIDFSSTVNFVVPLEASYQSMITDLSAIAKDFLAQSQSTAETTMAMAAQNEQNLQNVGFASLTFIVLLTLGLSILTVRSIRHVALATERLASGQTDIDLTELARRDELGAVIKALSVFRSTILKMDTLKRGFEDEIGRTVQALVAAVNSIQKDASALSSAARTMLNQASEAANLAEKASQSAHHSAHSTRALIEAVHQVSSHVSSSAHMSSETAVIVAEAQNKITELSEATARISNFTGVISGIASRTKLLALNATIESARVGEAGRGFAVVASEVKQLANQTEGATDEIVSNVSLVVAETATTIQSFDAIKDIVGKLSETTVIGASAVEEQNAATQEISRSLEESGQSTQEVARILQRTKTELERTGHMANSVSKNLDDLHTRTEELQESVGNFLRQLG